MSTIQDITLDHVAIGLAVIAPAREFMAGTLGGRPLGEWDEGPFASGQWLYADGARLELIAPAGAPGGFMHRFVEARGAGVHHVTFKVKDLRAARRAVEDSGLTVVGYDDSNPHWKELFIHPKQAQGIVVQLAQSVERPRTQVPAPDAARVLGVRLSAHSEELADRQWGQLLGGRLDRSGDTLVYHWADAPLRISVDVDPEAAPGPRFIELGAGAAAEFPDTVHPLLGTRFVRV